MPLATAHSVSPAFMWDEDEIVSTRPLGCGGTIAIRCNTSSMPPATAGATLDMRQFLVVRRSSLQLTLMRLQVYIPAPNAATETSNAPPGRGGDACARP